ncbi:peptide alpha-N-acetyltransferase Nat2 [Rhodotorula toruloides]|uniref:Peptide alpha-N-acetyltransferase Nat2 n=1 Tax=Rhodotorula toruloides TaxID=5286 RepID=A0A511KC73_RHOTO|nr:peptide alpha-N-acetyltransferase Nat2 [Rhodotorula toruloides]
MNRVPALRLSAARSPALAPPAALRNFSSSSSSHLVWTAPSAPQPPRAATLIALWSQRVAFAELHRRGLASSAVRLASNSTSSSSHQSSSSSSSSSAGQSSSSSSSASEDPDKIPLTQKIKYLFRKHGWTALAVYLLLSAIDFGLCFVVIYAVGADRVREAEDWVLDRLKWKRSPDAAVPGEEGRLSRAYHEIQEFKDQHSRRRVKGPEAHPTPEAAQAVAEGKDKETVAAVDKENKKDYSTLATTAILAYAIHKTALLPFRVGVTFAITPKVVRMLQGWGFKVGYAAGAPPVAAAAAAGAASKAAS